MTGASPDAADGDPFPYPLVDEDDLRRDARRIAGLAASMAMCDRLFPSELEATQSDRRRTSIAEIKRQLPSGWTVVADDICRRQQQPVLRGTWNDRPVVLKVLFQEIDVDRWRAIMAAATAAVGDANSGPLTLPYDVTPLRIQCGEPVSWPIVAYPRLRGPMLHQAPEFGSASEKDLRRLLAAIARALTIAIAASGTRSRSTQAVARASCAG
ncbi:MAG TPA: hypothetical protein VH583_09200 [Vicinamibacterales bacterium]